MSFIGKPQGVADVVLRGLVDISNVAGSSSQNPR